MLSLKPGEFWLEISQLLFSRLGHHLIYTRQFDGALGRGHSHIPRVPVYQENLFSLSLGDGIFSKAASSKNSYRDRGGAFGLLFASGQL